MIYLKTKYKLWQNNLTNEKWNDYVDSKKGPTEQWQDAWTEVARDRVHNLDLSISEHRDIYDSTLRTHIMFGEVIWHFESTDSKNFDFIDSDKYKTFQLPKEPIINRHVYKDTNTKHLKTIGIGFNMDRPEARNEWEKALGDSLSFDDVYNEKCDITDEQAYKLFDYSIHIRDQELRNKFGSDWDALKPNEKISTISIYYNSPSLVGPKFTANIKQYVATNDRKYLERAFFEVKHQSNPKTRIKKDEETGTEEIIEISVEIRTAVQKRMDRESAMIESYKCSVYSKPDDSPITNNISMQIIPGQTVVPRIGKLKIDKEELDEDGNKKQYYIWRTQGDNKVRLTHKVFEDKIFHIDNPPSVGHPGEDYNCRCFRDFNIPDFVQVKNYSGQIIRKYITNLYEIPGFCIK